MKAKSYPSACWVLLLIAVFFPLAACDSDESSSQESRVILDGSTYALSDSVEGLAVFVLGETVPPEEINAYLAIYEGEILLVETEAIAPGDYRVEDGDASAEYSDLIYDEGTVESGESYFATSGSVTIVSVSAEEVRGSYDLRLISSSGEVRRAEAPFVAEVREEEEETFSVSVRDSRVEFSFSEPSDLTGLLSPDAGDNVLSRLRAAVPGNSTLTGVRITRVKVDLLSPAPPDYDIGDLNSVEFYFVNGGDRQLVASGSGFTVGSMQSETTLTVRNSEVGSLVRDGLQVQAAFDASPDRLFRVEIEFDAVVSFN